MEAYYKSWRISIKITWHSVKHSINASALPPQSPTGGKNLPRWQIPEELGLTVLSGADIPGWMETAQTVWWKQCAPQSGDRLRTIFKQMQRQESRFCGHLSVLTVLGEDAASQGRVACASHAAGHVWRVSALPCFRTGPWGSSSMSQDAGFGGAGLWQAQGRSGGNRPIDHLSEQVWIPFLPYFRKELEWF